MKIALYVLAGLVALVAILGVAAPKHFHMEREIIIDKPNEVVFAHVQMLQNHDLWNAWTKSDPNIQKNYSGKDGTVGFKGIWVSQNPDVGSAIQEITNIVPGQRLDTVITFREPFVASFASYVRTEPMGKQTKVFMGMDAEMKFPMNVMSFVMNCLGQQKKIIDNTDQSLASLKALLEK